MCDEKVLREVFAAFDTDKSGTIDTKELKAVVTAYFQSVNEPADNKRIRDTVAVSIGLHTSSLGCTPLRPGNKPHPFPGRMS